MPAVNYEWDPVEDNIVREVNDLGVVTVDYTTEPFIYGNVLSEHRDEQTSYYHYDGQGSITEITDTLGNVMGATRFTAFGETVQSTVTSECPFQYIGQRGYYRIAETGQYLVRRRTYDSVRAAWHSPEPLDSMPSEWSPYVYVQNRPSKSIDPSGYQIGGEPLPFSETHTFVAGSDLSRPGCPGTAPHTVSYTAGDVTLCRLLIWGGATFSTLPCTRKLLKHFYDQVRTPYCPVECIHQLKQSVWFRRSIVAAVTDILEKSGGKALCGVNTNVNNTWRTGGPCQNPWEEFKRLNAENDLMTSIGALDKAVFSVTGSLQCEKAWSPCCCDCTAKIDGQALVSDLYDFISTLPPDEPKHSPFWCASVLEDYSGGVGVFQTTCSVRQTYTIKVGVCNFTAGTPETR